MDGERIIRALAGELVTETLDYDAGRQATAYIPPAKPTAVVFAGDGELIASWGEMLEAAGLTATMIVGVHRASDETSRLHEYSLPFDPALFAAHEKFFASDVRAWTKSRFGVAVPAERTAVCGSRPARSSHSLSGFGTRQSMASFSALHRVRGTSPRRNCRLRSRACTSSPVHGSHFSSTTRRDGRPLCAMRAVRSSYVSGPDPTATRSGEKSSH